MHLNSVIIVIIAIKRLFEGARSDKATKKARINPYSRVTGSEEEAISSEATN